MKLKSIFFSACLLATLLITRCAEPKKTKDDPSAGQINAAFTKVNGIRFFEAKRRFKNGLSFNKDGFMQEPAWIIQFKAPDSMLAYSADIDKFEAFYLQHDHGEVYNFAREFFRAIKITKDSLVLQRLQVDGKVIAGDDDLRSNVFSTYYTKEFIDKKLKTTLQALQKPTKADTIFIKTLSAQTDKDPGNPKIAFAARQPVVFSPKSKFVTAEKISTVDPSNHRTRAYDYIYPEYELKILKSYKDFVFRFSMIVDSKGKLYVNRIDGILPEDEPYRRKTLQGIADVYLSNLYKITPGTTLGIPHSSEITLIVVGRK